MPTINTTSLKVILPFKAGALPRIDPQRPTFEILLGSTRIHGQVNAKAARKLAAHQGGAVLQGRLIVERGQLSLVEAGFTWLDPKPPEQPSEA